MDNDYRQVVATYPVLMRRGDGVRVVCPTGGAKSKKKGPSELVSFDRVVAMGLSEICADVCVTLEGHRYEPDLAYVDADRGVYVDIEIDEPYSGSGKPTHYIKADGRSIDSERDRRFVCGGWHVARFSEEMLYLHPRECMRAVYDMLLQAGDIDALPPTLVRVADVERQPRWTFDDSRAMKRKRQRVRYLGFDPAKMGLRDCFKCLRLFVPIMWHSLFSRKLRKATVSELYGYFVK